MEKGEKETSINFKLKEAKEYYNYLHTLTEAGLASEWNKVINSLKGYFDEGVKVRKSCMYNRKSSSGVTF